MDSTGAVCIATLVESGITVVHPDDGRVEKYLLPDELTDPVTTNSCFSGPDLTTANITLAFSGRLISARWPRPGLRLPFQE